MDNSIAARRAELRLSQAALADQLSVSRQTINAIERGKYDPSLPLAFALARTFDCQIEELFYPEGEEAAAPAGR